MPIDYARLKGLAFADAVHSYSEHSAFLFALGLDAMAAGCGDGSSEAPDRAILDIGGAQALSSLAAVFGGLGPRRMCPFTGVDWTRAAHREQGLVLHRPLPAAGAAIARTKVTEILDEGAGGDALLYTERAIHDRSDDARLCTVSATTALLGQGGFGGPAYGPPPPVCLPERAPDIRLDLPATPLTGTSRAALPDRRGCDTRPARPPAAACLQQLTLPELATYAVAGRAVLHACCDDDPARLEGLHARFAAPVYADEAIRTEIWRDGPRIAFRCLVPARDSVVLSNGLAIVTE